MEKRFLLLTFLVLGAAVFQGCATVQCGGKQCISNNAQCIQGWKAWEEWKNNPPELNGKPEKMSQEQWELRLTKQREALQKFAPWILEEYKQIDEFMGWPEGFSERMSCYGIKNNIPPPDHECTSWLAMPDVTDNKCVILHKNRDSSVARLAVYRHQVPGKNAYIGCGGYGNLSPLMGFNDKGVAITMNAGDTTDDVHPYGLTTGQMLRIALECCDNAADATALLEKMTLSGAYRRKDCGSIWYVADSKTGFVAEASLHRFAYGEIKGGLSIRANGWHFPQMRAISKDGPGYMAYSLDREISVQKLLIQDALLKNGSISEKDIDIASRFRPDTEESKKRFTEKELKHMLRLCAVRTISGGTFVLDKEYPQFLSTGWIACGNIWHSIYIPYPVTLTDFPKKLTNATYADAIFHRYDKYQFTSPIDDAFKIEDEMRKAHNEAVANARELLRQNQKEDAIKLLNDTFAENWKKALEFHANRK